MYPQHIRLIDALTEINSGDCPRIHHFLTVYALASFIGRSEALDDETQFILETAAIVHDIGIKACERKYGTSNGRLQEQEGPPLARELLAGDRSFTRGQIERVCYLIAHHHTYDLIDGADYRILVEADFLVNLRKQNLSGPAAASLVRGIFKSPSALRLLRRMYGADPDQTAGP